MPKVSVIMPVYNAERFLESAIESIFTQTFTDYELLVINDGSTDRSDELLSKFSDPRLRIINNVSNKGLVRTLNIGIAHSQGEYIARMDADDLSHPARLDKQVSYLDDHSNTGLLGCAYWIIGIENNITSTQYFPTSNNNLQEKILLADYFCHPSVMIKRVYLDQVRGYDEAFATSEDYDLWLRLSEVCEIANLPEPLFYYRRYQGSKTSIEGARLQTQYDLLAQKKVIERRKKLACSENELIRRQLACVYIAVACRELILGKYESAEQDLSLAFECDSDYLTSGVFKEIVETCMTYLATAWSGWNSAVRSIEMIFGLLQSKKLKVYKDRKPLLADAYRHLAFEAYRNRERSRVQSSLLRSWWLQPDQLWKNRGMASIFLKSIFEN
jgi:glycosyltransferase involved in cell wall biosynthesis